MALTMKPGNVMDILMLFLDSYVRYNLYIGLKKARKSGSERMGPNQTLSV